MNTNVNFDINYLSGEVAGPIYWDSFALGPYEIGNQALGKLLDGFLFFFIMKFQIQPLTYHSVHFTLF